MLVEPSPNNVARIYGPPVIELEDVCVNIGRDRVLDHIALTIRAGELVGIAGPNGGGKSTLLRAILGLAPTCCGAIRLFDRPSAAFRERHRIGFIPQNASQIDATFPATAQEIVRLGRVPLRGLGRPFNADDRRIALAALREVGMEALRNRPIGAMSGGQRQRVFLARLLASEADLLILDEPTTGIDPRGRDDFLALLQRLSKAKGKTLVLVSHDTDVLAHATNRLIVIDRTIQYDAPLGPERVFPSHLHLHDPRIHA